jgi:hypothetical protein
MIVATLVETMRDAGTVCGALVAILTLFALMSRLRPVRWIFRHLVADPFGEWCRVQVREELDRENGGSTLKDQVKTTAADMQKVKAVLGITEDEEDDDG